MMLYQHVVGGIAGSSRVQLGLLVQDAGMDDLVGCSSFGLRQALVHAQLLRAAHALQQVAGQPNPRA